MSPTVEFSVQPFAGYSQLGMVRLNAPKSINALSLDMILAITQQLEVWADDPHIAAIWLEGAGQKGFCAGGNVIEVYRSLEQQDGGVFSYQYFHSEYQLDLLLSTFPKPVICWGHGYVMGGGMGLFMASQYRLVTQSSRLAMPEISIGLYPDVGATYFLNQLPSAIARFLALTAFQVNAADACTLGLASHYVAEESRIDLLTALAEGETQTMSVERIETHIERVLYGVSADHVPSVPPVLASMSQELEHLMSGDIHTISQAMQAFSTEDSGLMRAREVFLKGSPLSACIILEQLKWGHDRTLEQALERETILSMNLCLEGDFAEGVRALLIDKDKHPHWCYASIEDVDQTSLQRFFEEPEQFTQIQSAAALSSQSLATRFLRPR